MNNIYEEIKLIVSDNENFRIDKYLVIHLKSKNWSRTKIQELITNEKIIVNNKKINSNYLVKLNDEIIINYLIKKPLQLEADTKQKLDIIYEDESLLVINKPKNLVVHPAPGNYQNTLVNILLGEKKTLAPNNEFRPGIVHRIDKDTTGLLLIAKTSFVQDHLSQQLQTRTLKRKYFALVYGTINEDKGRIEAPIGRSSRDRKKMAVTSKNSRIAITYFEVVERFKNHTLIECQLETGRTHQIRVHLSYIKHPIVGDHKYGYLQDLKEKYHQFLHAHYLSFIHPILNKKIELKVEVPEVFNEKLMNLRKEK